MAILSLALSDDALDALADALGDRLAVRLAHLIREQSESDDRWFDTEQAAQYLGRPVSTIRKLTASRLIPFEQSSAGARCYFKRRDLDRWMQS